MIFSPESPEAGPERIDIEASMNPVDPAENVNQFLAKKRPASGGGGTQSQEKIAARNEKIYTETYNRVFRETGNASDAEKEAKIAIRARNELDRAVGR